MASLDIPQIAPFVQAAFKQTHINAEIEPSGAEQLTYRVAVPKTWPFSSEMGPVPTGLLQMRGLGFFASANAATAPVIAVTATNVPYEVPLDAWAKVVFASEGYEVVAGSWFPGPSGLFYDITGTRIVKDVPEVRRSAVRAQGNEILCLNCMCALSEWEAAKEVFWVAMVTFELANAKPTRMEPWLRGAAENPAFEFAFPGSWDSEPVQVTPEGVSAVDVRLGDEDGKLMGYVQVRAEKLDPDEKPKLAELEASALKRLKSSGYETAEEPKPLDEHNDPRALSVKGWLGGFTDDGTIMGGDVTTRRGHVERDGIVYSLSMLSPRTENNPLVALRTQRAFEIARATLNPL